MIAALQLRAGKYAIGVLSLALGAYISPAFSDQNLDLPAPTDVEDLTKSEQLYGEALRLHQQGSREAANAAYERALGIETESLTIDDLDKNVNRLAVLGRLQHRMGNYEPARTHLKRLLEIRENTAGSEAVTTADALHHLGSLLRSMGYLNEAKEHLERALAIREQSLGSDDPLTAASISELGLLLRDMGDYAAAKERLTQAWTLRMAILGFDHVDVLISADNVSNMHRLRGTPNKSTADVRALAAEYGPAAITELARLSTKGESEQVRVSACRELLDRAFGKAVAYHDITHEDLTERSELTDLETIRRFAVFSLEAGDSGYALLAAVLEGQKAGVDGKSITEWLLTKEPKENTT